MSLLSAWLRPQHILLEMEVTTKTGLFEQVAQHLAQTESLSAKTVLSSLQQREALGSTALGQGMALPHARLKSLSEPVLVFVRPVLPIDFDAPDDKPVSEILLLLVPIDAPQRHLELLAEIARCFQDRDFRQQLQDSSSVDQVLSLLAG